MFHIFTTYIYIIRIEYAFVNVITLRAIRRFLWMAGEKPVIKDSTEVIMSGWPTREDSGLQYIFHHWVR